MWHRLAVLIVVIGCGLPPAAQADWSALVRQLKQQVAHTDRPSEAEIVAGLKQALEIGTRRAVKKLGHPGGFLADKAVRVPLPKNLRSVARGLRGIGEGKVVNEFIASMNHAAEDAVPKATSIFVAAIHRMTLNDARKILQGPNDAATRYFRRHTETKLETAMLPVVREATAHVGVTRSYKRFIGRAGFLSHWVSPQSLDLDRYVTNKALDGLFLKMADEEKRIRKDPVARTTELLRKVFGHD